LFSRRWGGLLVTKKMDQGIQADVELFAAVTPWADCRRLGKYPETKRCAKTLSV
jgi:hypothetical protein